MAHLVFELFHHVDGNIAEFHVCLGVVVVNQAVGKHLPDVVHRIAKACVLAAFMKNNDKRSITIIKQQYNYIIIILITI